jgi:hypothetical protein
VSLTVFCVTQQRNKRRDLRLSPIDREHEGTHVYEQDRFLVRLIEKKTTISVCHPISKLYITEYFLIKVILQNDRIIDSY